MSEHLPGVGEVRETQEALLQTDLTGADLDRLAEFRRARCGDRGKVGEMGHRVRQFGCQREQ